MTHTTRAPIESLRGQDPLTDWALGMRERTLSPLATLAGEAKRFQGLSPEEMGMELVGGGMAGSIKKLAGKSAKTEFELAHELAQKNASLPIEKGGLGLPDNNTAMDRAKAMGFDTPAYHGTDKNFTEFRPGFAEGQGHGIYTSTNPLDTHEFASSSSGGNTMPLMVNLRNPVRDLTDPLTDEFPINERTKELIRLGFDGSIMKNANNLLGDEVVAFKPNQIRSRFASFDPFNRNSANILAGGAGGAVGLSSLAYPYGDEYQ